MTTNTDHSAVSRIESNVLSVNERQLQLGRHQTNIINETYDYAYFAIPKSANTAVKYALLPTIQRSRKDKIDGKPILRFIHEKNGVVYDYAPLSVIAKKMPSLRFTVVRNTWERIASCYNDKIVSKFHAPFEIYGFNGSMSFNDFVSAISNIDDRHAEIHFRSQYSMLFFKGLLLPNVIIKSDNIFEQWPIVDGYFQSRFNILIDPISEINKKGTGNYNHIYTEETANIVYKRYKKEIEFFGFNFS